MSGGSADGGGRGTTTTLTIEKPDGSVTEVVRHDSGRVTTRRTGRDGVVGTTYEVAIETAGVATVVRYRWDEQPQVLSPDSIRTSTNAYGSTVEALDYPGGTSVENTFDDDGNLRSVVMKGDWGEQTTELRPDGGRTLRWMTTLHHGSQTWDAGGRLMHYELTCSDDSRYRWELLDEQGRAVLVDADGRTEVIEDAPSPTGQ